MPLPDQVVYTVSCGFPAPYFDVEILNSHDSSYYYRMQNSGMVIISAVMNAVTIIILFTLFMYMAAREKIILNRLLNIMLILIILFSSGLLLPYFPEILQNLSLYIYAYPVMIINSVLEKLGIEAFEQNISPRVYLVLLSILIYYLVHLGLKIKSRFSAVQ